MTDLPQRPPFTHARRGSTRTTGLLVAAGVGLAAAGLVGYIALARPKPEDAPRLKPPPVPTETLTGTPGDRQGTAEGVRIELADKKDPSRVASVLLAKSVKPQKGRMVDVEQPGALIFLQDGRTLRIKARAGSFSSFSTEQAPERGTFAGDVRLLIYPPTADSASKAKNWDTEKPLVDASLGDTFEFDMTFGKAVVPGRFSISSDEFSIQGTQAEIVLDEAAGGLRMLRIAKDARIERLAKAAEKPAAGTKPPTPPTSPATGEKKPEIEALYRVAMDSPVEVVAGPKGEQRTINASNAEGFMRLVDNRLRKTAIAKFPTAAAAKDGAKQDGQAAAASEASADETAVGADEAFVLTTTGALEIRIAETAPPELAKNDLFVRLRGADKPVRFTDTPSKASGVSPAIEYAATRGEVTLIGDKPSSIELTSENEGTFKAQRFTLFIPTKLGQSIGPGGLAEIARPAQIGEPERRARAIEWSDQADFEFAFATPRQGKARSNAWEIRTAQLSGNVIGADGVSGLNADFLKGEFGPGSQLTHAVLSGGKAHEGATGALTAETIDLKLRTLANGKTEPQFLTAIGSVEARDKDQLLTGGLIEATLGRVKANQITDELLHAKIGRSNRDEVPQPVVETEADRDDPGKLKMTNLIARENVTFQGEDSVVGSTNELVADLIRGRATMIGRDSAINRDASSVQGDLIRLYSSTKTIKIDGPGSFETAGDGTSGPLGARVVWTGSMRYSDRIGVLDTLGGVNAVSLTDATTIDRVTADRVQAQVEHRIIPGEPAVDAQSLPTRDRRVTEVVSMTALNVPGSGSPPAHVESKTYDGPVSLASTADRRMVQTRSLDGDTIIARPKDGTLDVPGAGRILMFDRRDQSADSPEPGDQSNALASAANSFRGAALFEWRDKMAFSRTSGIIDLFGGAKITHDRPADHSLIYVESDRVTAKMSGLDAPKPSKIELIEADATGNVFARFKTAKSERELNAFRAIYRREKGTLNLLAGEGGEVSLFDKATATPVKAAELVWDLNQDRVEIVKPSPITAPITNPPR